MPNLCTGFINVRGRADCVDEFIAILQANYSYCPNSKNGDFTWVADPNNMTHIPHFFRVFEADLFDDPVWHSGVYKSASISIEVAWSVWTCMFNGPHTYYDDFQKNHFGDHFGSNILAESKRLQLEIEIWSYESGMCFQEHYKICSGILVKNEEFSFNIFWLDDYSNYKEFLEVCNDIAIPLTEQEFKERIKCQNYYYEHGLQEEDVDFLPEDKPIYLANIVMVKPIKEE